MQSKLDMQSRTTKWVGIRSKMLESARDCPRVKFI